MSCSIRAKPPVSAPRATYDFFRCTTLHQRNEEIRRWHSPASARSPARRFSVNIDVSGGAQRLILPIPTEGATLRRRARVDGRLPRPSVPAMEKRAMASRPLAQVGSVTGADRRPSANAIRPNSLAKRVRLHAVTPEPWPATAWAKAPARISPRKVALTWPTPKRTRRRLHNGSRADRSSHYLSRRRLA